MGRSMFKPMCAVKLGAAALALAVACLGPAPAHADIVVLNHGNSSATYETGPSATGFQTSWIVDGVDHLSHQGFYFRIGDAPETDEASVASLFQTNIDISDPAQLVIQYADAAALENATFTITISATLTGGAPGSGVSDLEETIIIENLSGGPLNFRFFQFADFDLGGTVNDASVSLELGTMTAGATQTDLTSVLAESVAAFIASGPITTHMEANTAPNTLDSFFDGVPTTLNGNSQVNGPADLTWAFEWEFTLNAGESFVLNKDKALVAAPEPSSLALLGLAGAALLRRRRA